jgi:heptosyltransferase I
LSSIVGLFPYLKDLKHPRFLIVRLSAYGDIIQSWPLVGLIRQQWPQAHIAWLVEPAGAILLKNLPGLDQVIELPQKHWLAQLKRHPHRVLEVLAQVRQFQSSLAAAQFDIALDPQGLFKSALWPALAGIPHRVGFESPREAVGWAYTHRVVRPDDGQGGPHASVQFASLIPRPPDGSMPSVPEVVAHWPVPPLSDEAQKQVSQWLGNAGDELKASQSIGLASSPFPLPEGEGVLLPLLVLAPATTWASKHWPQRHWTELLRLLSGFKVRVVMVGGPADQAYCQALLAEAGQWPAQWQNRVGQTDWQTLQALLHRADGFLGPDSAPLHLACAVAANRSSPTDVYPMVVGLYGPTVLARTGPLPLSQSLSLHCADNGLDQVGGHIALTHPLPCTGCHQRTCRFGHTACLAELSPQTVLTHLVNRLALEPLAP